MYDVRNALLFAEVVDFGAQNGERSKKERSSMERERCTPVQSRVERTGSGAKRRDSYWGME